MECCCPNVPWSHQPAHRHTASSWSVTLARHLCAQDFVETPARLQAGVQGRGRRARRPAAGATSCRRRVRAATASVVDRGEGRRDHCLTRLGRSQPLEADGPKMIVRSSGFGGSYGQFKSVKYQGSRNTPKVNRFPSPGDSREKKTCRSRQSSPTSATSGCPEGARWDVARADMTPRSHQPRGQMAFAGVWKKAAVQSRLLSARRRRSGKPAEVG